ncbi:MAG: hypothetical protein KJO12_05450, partial [Ignavibacteria bacterium]|nr:hypothetical protein [Ignavibacteria bacterium]
MSDNKIEKQTFTYPLVFGLLYKYGNIAVTLLLVFYTVPIVFYVDQNYILLIPIVISLLLIYFVNRQYFALYKIISYKIEADDEKLVCSDYFLSKEVITIYFEDIESLKGGMFENKISGVMKVYDGKSSITLGFYTKLKNSSRLVTIILSKVRKELYDDVLDRLT